MPASEELSAFYHSLATEADLARLVEERAQEDLHLEFKTKANPSTLELAKQDGENFSKALSGFANSDGGVLIWGIKGDDQERAKELRPVVDCSDFQGRLKKSLLNAVQPAVDGVLIEVIRSADPPRYGYVKCLIPPGDAIPHRAMLAGREYYKRSVEGFYRLEHFDLEDLFGRRPVPKLQLRARVLPRGSSGSSRGERFHGLVIVSIENSGRGAARAPYLVLEARSKHQLSEYGIDGNRNEGLRRIASATPGRHFYHSADVVIPPDFVHDVAAYTTEGFIVPSSQQWIMPDEVRIAFKLGAENTQSQEGELAVTPTQISQAIHPNYHYLAPLSSGE
jgi:hypothetical protein